VAQGHFYDGKFFAVNSKKGVNQKTGRKVRCLDVGELGVLRVWECCVYGSVVCMGVLCVWECCVYRSVVCMGVVCVWECCVWGSVVCGGVGGVKGVGGVGGVGGVSLSGVLGGLGVCGSGEWGVGVGCVWEWGACVCWCVGDKLQKK
jgi:hypothetical protein